MAQLTLNVPDEVFSIIERAADAAAMTTEQIILQLIHENLDGFQDVETYHRDSQ